MHLYVLQKIILLFKSIIMMKHISTCLLTIKDVVIGGTTSFFVRYKWRCIIIFSKNKEYYALNII